MNFKVGDKVIHVRSKDIGIVIEIQKNSRYSVRILYNDGSKGRYDQNGVSNILNNDEPAIRHLTKLEQIL